jgi:aryl carrier-like protein
MGKEPGLMLVTNVPNSRIAGDIHVLKWLSGTGESTKVGDYRQYLAEGKAKEIGIDPNDILELARDLPFHIAVTLSCSPGIKSTYNILFRHRDFKMENRSVIRGYHSPGKAMEILPWHMYTNNPLLVKISGKLVPGLRDFLKERLPEYMVPSHFVFLDRLPLTSNGKLDRKALFLHEPVRTPAASTEQENQFIEPRTPTEKIFAEIWESVLFIDKVGINHNFFELGGDSINAIQVISRANKQGFNLTIRDLYQDLTIAELVQSAGKNQACLPGEELSDNLLLEIDKEELLRSLPPGVEVEAIHPLTPFQRHMLFHYLKDPAKENEPGLFVTYRAGRLPYEQLDISLVQEAFQRITGIYPYLRTAFIWEKVKKPVQIVHKKVETRLQYYDWTHLSPGEQDKQFRELAVEDYCRGFERDKPEAYRISILKMREGDYRYILTADYMRVDGWSTTLVMNTFVSYCLALAAGGTFDLEDYSDSDYRDFHVWLHRQDATRGQHFWRGMLEGCTFPTPLAAQAPGNIPGDDRGFARQHRYLSIEETRELELLIKTEQLVLSTLGWAAWAMLLGRYTSEEKVIFGILVSGRSSAQAFVETMVGQTLNVLPAQVKVSPGKPLLEWLREIWAIQVELSQYEYTPQDKIREWWDVPPGKHLFESYLVVMNFPGIRQGMKESPQPTRTVHDYIAQLEYPLRVDLYPGPELCLIMHYYRRYFNDAAIEKMLDDFYTLINKIPKNLHRTIGELMELISI